MQNSVKLNSEGIVEAFVIGDQDYESFRKLANDADPLLIEQRKKGNPVLGLVDLTKKGHYTAASNRAAMEMLEKMDYDRVAMFGTEAVLKEVTEMIILAMGKHDKTKLFHTRDEAMAWLKSPLDAKEEPAAL